MAAQPLPVQHFAVAAHHPELGLRDPAQNLRQDAFDHGVHRLPVGRVAVVAHEKQLLAGGRPAGTGPARKNRLSTPMGIARSLEGETNSDRSRASSPVMQTTASKRAQDRTS